MVQFGAPMRNIVFPTCMGMNRVRWLGLAARPEFPHMRGLKPAVNAVPSVAWLD